jgi:hypothetical protein
MAATSNWYLNRDNWGGSHFGLGIELGPRDDQRLLQGLRSVWTSPLIVGPLVAPYGGKSAIDESLLLNNPVPHLHGTVDVNGRLVGCLVMALRWDSDWLSVAIPSGMFHRLAQVEYPLYQESNPWLHDVERQLAQLADHVHKSVSFDFAVIGEEATGSASALGGDETPRITRDAIEQDGGYLLSAQLWQQLLPDTRSQLLPSGLHWVPICLFAGRSV